MDNYLRKGDKVTATWIDGEFKTVTGVVTHIHGDDPINPKVVKVAIEDVQGIEHWVDLNFVRKYHA